MADFSFNSDKVERLGMIDKKTIFEYVTQSQIFKMVFGFLPRQYQYVKSPFREDSTPNCWFEMYDDKLLFKDFGNPKKKHYDCFDAVQHHFKLNNFYETLKFVSDTLISGKQLTKIVKHNVEITKRVGVTIDSFARDFEFRDAKFWLDFDIGKDELMEDQVFATQKYKVINGKNGDYVVRPDTICYTFAEFEGGRKKLYLPKKKGKGKFITNCNKNDIGSLQHLVPCGNKLIISKSYKDCRILRNLGFNAIWFQNEGMMPDLVYLLSIVKNFKDIIIWFDNDRTGIEAARKISSILKIYLPDYIKVRVLWLPEPLLEKKVTDPGDFVKKFSIDELRVFTNQRV